MKVLDSSKKNFDKLLDNLLMQRKRKVQSSSVSVTNIIKDVKKNGDKALLKYERKFNKNNIIVPSVKQINKSIKSLDKNKLITVNGGHIQKISFKPQINTKDSELINKYILYLESNNYMPPTDKTLSSELMNYLINNNFIIKCTGNVFYSIKQFEKLKKIRLLMIKLRIQDRLLKKLFLKKE